MNTVDAYLINPPSPHDFQANRDFMGGFGASTVKNATKIPCMWVESLAGNLTAAGIRSESMDCAIYDLSISEIISRLKTSIVGFYCGTASFIDDLRFATQLKEKGNFRTFMFGPQVSVTQEFALRNSSLDVVIVGEAEITVVELVRAFINCDGSYKSVHGIAYIENGQYTETQARDLCTNLDKFAFPYRRFDDYSEYFYKRNDESPFIAVQGSRGCPYKCLYCPYPVSQGTCFRTRSPENIIQEMLDVKKKLNYKMVLFRDPIFSFDRKKTEKLCKLMMEKKLDIVWRCETSTGKVDDDLLKLMKNAGCVGINFGVETGNSEMSEKHSKKSGGLEQVRNVFSSCKKLGIETTAFFIVGLPGETKQSLRDTMRFIKTIDPTDLIITTATPFPGTELYNIAKQNGAIRGDEFEHFRVYQPYSGVPGITAEQLRKKLRNLYIGFYLRPGRLYNELRKDPLVFIKKSFSMMVHLSRKQ